MNIYAQITSNRLKTYFIIALFIGLISLAFYGFGKYIGDAQTYMTMGIVFSLFSSVGSYFYSDKIVLAMTGAKPADKKDYFDYYTVTENLCIAAGIPMPKLYVIKDDAPNAFATGRDPKHAAVAATTGLLNRLERSEIEGVIGHELSHVRNYDILVMTIVGVLVGTVAYAADFAMRGMFWGGRRDNDREGGNALGTIMFLLFLVVLPLVASLIQLAVSRRREFLADASGALLTRNPDALASALEKISSDPHTLHTASHATAHLFISNPFGARKTRDLLTNLFSTHPPVDERIRILRSM